jgi:hypothetical protein
MTRIEYDALVPDPWDTHCWWITCEDDAIAGMDANFQIEGIKESKINSVAALVVDRCSEGVVDTSEGGRLSLSSLLEVDLTPTFSGEGYYWVRADERETGTYIQVVLWGDSVEVIWFPGQTIYGMDSSQFAYFPGDPPPRPPEITARPEHEQRRIFRVLAQFALDLADAGGATLVGIAAANDVDFVAHPDQVLWRSD